MANRSAAVGAGDDDDNWGISRANAATTASSTSEAALIETLMSRTVSPTTDHDIAHRR